MTSTLDNFRKKLLYISTHRGTKEGDLVVGVFAQNNIFALDEAQLHDFCDILDYTDVQIMEWLKNPSKIPLTINPKLVEDIQIFTFNKSSIS